MIDVIDLTKYYGSKCALDKISFSVKRGEIMGLLGPNGAGKSTAMKIITGFLAPTEGTVKLDGYDIVDNSLEVRRHIGYLPEHPPLYGDMTVAEYLKFCAKIKGVPRARVKAAVSEGIEKCGLKKYHRALCRSLSKGYRQRVGIAQAMINAPDLLILDEPTIGLDPIQIIEIRDLIKTFGGEHTVIISTHILPEVEMVCERVTIINDGHIVAQDSTDNLRTTMPGYNDIIVRINGRHPDIEAKLTGIEGIVKVTDDSSDDTTTTLMVETDGSVGVNPRIAHCIVHDNIELLELKNMSMTLEEIFIKVTMN